MAKKSNDDPSVAKKVFLVLAGISIGVALFLLAKVVPTFADVFASFGAKLPSPASFVIRLSFWFQGFNTAFGAFEVAGLSYLAVLPLWNWRKLGSLGAFFAFLLPALFVVFVVFVLFMPMFEIGNTTK